MKRWFAMAAVLCVALIAGTAHAGNGTPIDTGSADGLTLAVFGDWPHGDAVFNAAPLLISSINADPKDDVRPARRRRPAVRPWPTSSNCERPRGSASPPARG